MKKISPPFNCFYKTGQREGSRGGKWLQDCVNELGVEFHRRKEGRRGGVLKT